MKDSEIVYERDEKYLIAKTDKKIIVENSYVFDRTISMEAKGIFTVILGMPKEESTNTLSALADSCCKRAITSKNNAIKRIKELIERGYMNRVERV